MASDAERKVVEGARGEMVRKTGWGVKMFGVREGIEGAEKHEGRCGGRVDEEETERRGWWCYGITKASEVREG